MMCSMSMTLHLPEDGFVKHFCHLCTEDHKSQVRPAEDHRQKGVLEDVATMTRVALTKLAFLVILAFIICLPDFFIINRELHVSLRCVRPLLCGEEESGEQIGEWSSSTCGEHWEQMGAAADQRNMTRAEGRCFVCQADVNMAGLDHNSSSSDETLSVEVSLTLRQSDAASLNITVPGRYNHSSRYLRFSDEEKEKNNEPTDSFLYCPPSVDTTNHSCCLLWLSVQIFAGGGLPWKHSPKDEWWCVLWVVWLSLMGVVLLLVIMIVTRITEGKRGCFDKAKIHPFNYTGHGHHLIDNEKHQEINTANGLRLDKNYPYSWSALSSIEEGDVPDETNVFYTDYTDEGYNGNVHHLNFCSSSTRRTDCDCH